MTLPMPKQWSPPRFVALSAVILVLATATVARAAGTGESHVGTPVQGERGVSRTTADIMAQQANAQGLFALTSTQYAPLQTKISTAYQHGAAAVILCTGEHEINKNLAVQQKQWQAAAGHGQRPPARTALFHTITRLQ